MHRPIGDDFRFNFNISFETRGAGGGGSVVQCLTRDLKVVSSILAHGSFLVRGAALSR